MAPSTRTQTQEKNEKPRLRKPAMEKIRRDRINTGIERLKLLLKDELNPKSKLEKADILEKAVAYLEKRMALTRASLEQCYAEGFARCLEETARFLRVHNGSVMMSCHAVHHTATGSVNAVKNSPERTGAVWRPW